MQLRSPTVLIYRNHLLPHSETFIREQVSGIEKYDCRYVGFRRVPGLTLPPDKVVTAYGPSPVQKMSELSYKISGFSPLFIRQLRRLSPRLVHAHFGPDAVRAIPLSKHLNIPLVVTFHGYDLTVKSSHAWRSSFSQLIYILRKHNLKQKAVHFIAVSDFIKKILLEQNFPHQKISTHYIGIDTSLFAPDTRIQRTSSVLFVGRLVDMKGCEYLIRAMSKVQSTFPATELVVVGDGPLRSSLEKMARQRLKKYRFLGFQSPSVVRGLMNSSKVFCVPSITTKTGHSEAFGMVFAEAQAMGLPVVSFDSGGISEAVAHNETGLLAVEKHVDALSENLLSLLKDPLLWQDMSQKAIRRVREKFDIHRQSRLLEEIYSKVIAQS